MTTEYDLGPASMQVARVAAGVRDEHLGLPTPCNRLVGGRPAAASPRADDRVRGHCAQDPVPRGRVGAADRTAGGLAGAARTTTRGTACRVARARSLGRRSSGGGVTMPAAVMGTVAIDELVLHGWDLARATGQPFESDPASVEASLSFAASMSVPGEEEGREGLYGPVVPVPDDASDLDRLLGYAGRDPRWAASGQMVGD
ncbi:TIGR03086 family protein [Rhodococcus hoagii]|nr:TIGR03086 family protein [Prescottella equi]